MRTRQVVITAIAVGGLLSACASGDRIDDPLAYLTQQIDTPRLGADQAAADVAAGRCQSLLAQTVSGYGVTRSRDILAVTEQIEALIAEHGADHYSVNRLQWMPAARAGSRLEVDVNLLDCAE